MQDKILFTSESVSEGHPDKICDQISDAILDEILKQDENAHVACECFITTNFLLIGGEISSHAKVDYEKIARNVLREIGYTDNSWGIDANTCEIEIKINEQSVDINQGVKLSNNEIGAGDQGIIFGFATNETYNYMPLPISIAHDLVYTASKLRKNNQFKWARPDMKSQVTIDYTDAANPVIDTILMSIQHDPNFDEDEFMSFVKNDVMKKVAEKHKMNTDFKILLNPTGRFVIGGPQGDTGLTGRKIIVDTYGGTARHGGGAFSGKDATKVDRSAAYMARYAAKNLVAAGYAEKIEMQLSYAIGIAKPISIFVETFNSELVNKNLIYLAINNFFDFSVGGIINKLMLKKPVFFKTSKYGHFGKDQEFHWEKLNEFSKLVEFKEKHVNVTRSDS
ncbi:methionine adenosyltransferase [Spiroplasma endosymbiont of Labia minor]|uniref:methionine adenosyltransferase n=1 Tax=Spiroplasma endosymbiont of Labia minor TaxID=3066305 RepID=UPI0030CDE67D